MNTQHPAAPVIEVLKESIDSIASGKPIISSVTIFEKDKDKLIVFYTGPDELSEKFNKMLKKFNKKHFQISEK
jgi:hypothetical protein